MTTTNEQSSREQELRDALADVLAHAVNTTEFEYLRKGIGTNTAKGKALLAARAILSAPTAITAEEAGREGEAKDGARLDWLAEQDGCNLVSDDAGRWQVSDAGMQPVPPDGGFKEDVSIVSIAFHENWKPTIREAIDAAMLPPAPAQSGGKGNG